MTEQTWRKSSRSTSEPQCVELAVTAEKTAVRDTKNRTGGTLGFEAHAFAEFLAGVKAGRHDPS